LDSNDKRAGASQGDTADSLREQAAACRRLSLKSRTRAGAKALQELGNHFDEQASRIDPFGDPE
jgi:hypothetical protein